MKMQNTSRGKQQDALISALVFVLAFALYVRTLAPSVLGPFDDTLEIHYVVPHLGILHPTGYPLYTLLGKLFTLSVPLGDHAFRLNLFSAFTGALAAACVYLAARQIVSYRIAAIIAALIFAVGDTFWAQAVAAEVYALQMLLAALLLCLTLRYAPSSDSAQDKTSTRHALWVLAFAMGLGLTHHRLIILLYPAIAIYVLLVNRAILRDWKPLTCAAILFAAPLLLYLYLPLRGAVGSADGTYENTLQGFIAWATASQYTVFLTQDPFQVQRDAAYYWTLFQNQFTLAGLVLAAIGTLWLLRKPREWTLLVVALIVEAGFAFNYRTADVQVHFLTTFLLIAILAGIGADALFSIFSTSRIPNHESALLPILSFILLSILLLLIPVNLLLTNYASNDLSSKWDVHDYGLDILNQPLEKDATIIGILGEMTLIRYFQETQGLRPDVQTIAADKEEARLATIGNTLKQNRVVYLTRQLKGAAERYSLTSMGPLIRVHPQPVMGDAKPPQSPSEDFSAGIKLLGYELDTARLNAVPSRWHAENGRVLRVTLDWKPTEKIESDALVSVKIVRSDQRIVGQMDHRPVLDAYPTPTWRAGEVIRDTYDVPVFLGATPGDYIVNVTMYDAKSGAVIGQRDLGKGALGPDTIAPRRSAWNIAHTADADFGSLALVGYSLDTDALIRPGDTLPITLLWRAGAMKLPDKLMAQVWLEDAAGKHVASRDTPISVGYPPFRWEANMYVRDWPPIHVPANVADGQYVVKLAVSRNNQLFGSTLLPFNPTIVHLGQVEIRNRQRVMTAPTIAHPLEATFDQKIKLLGYAWGVDTQQRTAQLTLYWRSLTLMDTSYTVFVHVLDSKSQVVGSGDALPGNGEFPTTGWIENEYITDVHTSVLPPDVSPDTYLIEIGLYDPITGARLKTGEGQDQLILSSITIP